MTVIHQLGASIEEDYPTIAWDLAPGAAERFLEFDALLRAGTSTPETAIRSVELVTQGGRRRWPFDVISLTPGFAVSDRARAVFSEWELPGLQFARFSLNSQPFYLLHSNRCVDALDREGSEIEYFRTSPGRVKQILRYAFKPRPISVLDLFRIPELSDGACFYAGPLFVTDGVVTAIQSSGLVGFRFERLS